MPTANKIKILHVFNDPKFSADYFEFLIRHNVNLNNHFLFHYRCKKSTCRKYGMRTIFSPGFFSPIPNLLMLRPLFQSEKIIIHSLASPFLLIYLYLFPSLTQKSYWAIWGKDLYFYNTLTKIHFYHKIYEYFRKKVIKKIPNIVSISQGDVELAKKWYGSIALQHHCFGYPSNCYKELAISNKHSSTTVILVGNSADPCNNHLEAFSLIKKYRDDDIKVITPLSYGNKSYAENIIKEGNKLFGNKYFAIEELMPLSSYLNLLANVDIGVFAHNRQQAMGSIITLLSMSKKLYIRKNVTTWRTLNDLGLKVFDLYNINLLNPEKNILSHNREIIKNYFSEENLLHQWLNIFDHQPKQAI